MVDVFALTRVYNGVSGWLRDGICNANEAYGGVMQCVDHDAIRRLTRWRGCDAGI